LENNSWYADVFPSTLFPKHIADASQKRRNSFIAGRLCAEHSLELIGLQHAVGCGAFGEPVWPPGVKGSITHNDLIACAVVTQYDGPFGIGIDSELIVDGNTQCAIERLCLTQCEQRRWIRGKDDGVKATLLFSAKEAFYKAIHPVVRRFVDFLEVEVEELDESNGVLWLRPNATLGLSNYASLVPCHYVVNDRAVHTIVQFSDYEFPSSPLAELITI
jgi:enterobactin synthetase component D